MQLEKIIRQISFRSIIITAVLILSAIDCQALDLPVKRIRGKAYYYYTVTKKDRPYDLPDKLGVKRSDITRYNPHAADGLTNGMVLTFPVEIDAEIRNGYYTIDYKPEKNESIYGVSKRFDVPVDQIIEFNPRANEGVKGLTLVIPLEQAGTPAVTPTTGDAFPYVIAKGETISRIALKNNLKVQDIVTANPGMDPDKCKAGQTIMIPRAHSLSKGESAMSTTVVAENKPAVPECETPLPSEIYTPVAVADSTASAADRPVKESLQEPLRIALTLPFMLNEPNPDKASDLTLEFYRGFLLGAMDLSHNGDRVEIMAFDTAESSDTLRKILKSPELKNADVIVGPQNEAHLAMLAEHADTAGCYVLNVLAVKDESYKGHAATMQGNIPHPAMYRKAIDYFISRYCSNATPVFLSRVDGNADKIEFINELRQALNDNNTVSREIVYQNFLSPENLEGFNVADSAYVFIPLSGSRTEFNKIAPALKNLKITASDPGNVSIFGYPEWITFRNEQLTLLQDLNATIYTRYFPLVESPLADMLKEEYQKYYGAEMTEAVPSPGVLGYDTAIFLIKSLRNNEGDFEIGSMDYDGIQTGFSMVRPADADGFVNYNLYFVDFLPGGQIKKSQQ